MEVVASLSQGRTAAAQYGLFTHKSVPVIFEPPCSIFHIYEEMESVLIYSGTALPKNYETNILELQKSLKFESKISALKNKVFAPRGHMGEWRYSSTHS